MSRRTHNRCNSQPDAFASLGVCRYGSCWSQRSEHNSLSNGRSPSAGTMNTSHGTFLEFPQTPKPSGGKHFSSQLPFLSKGRSKRNSSSLAKVVHVLCLATHERHHFPEKAGVGGEEVRESPNQVFPCAKVFQLMMMVMDCPFLPFLFSFLARACGDSTSVSERLERHAPLDNHPTPTEAVKLQNPVEDGDTRCAGQYCCQCYLAFITTFSGRHQGAQQCFRV